MNLNWDEAELFAKTDKSAGSSCEEITAEIPTNKKPSASKLNIEYTQEQLDFVQRINKSRNCYEILGITREATNSKIKKAFKKLAVKLHPDKNKAPGAAEAFKTLRNAQDEAERYCKIFSFRSSNPQQGAAPPRKARRQPPQETTYGCWIFLVVGLAIFFIVILSMLAWLLAPNPLFRLQQTPEFFEMRRTLKLKIPYYVKQNFHNKYQGSLNKLERVVEEEYILKMKMMCYDEREYRNEMIKRAQELKMPTCDALNQLNNA